MPQGFLSNELYLYLPNKLVLESGFVCLYLTLVISPPHRLVMIFFVSMKTLVVISSKWYEANKASQRTFPKSDCKSFCEDFSALNFIIIYHTCALVKTLETFLVSYIDRNRFSINAKVLKP